MTCSSCVVVLEDLFRAEPVFSTNMSGNTNNSSVSVTFTPQQRIVVVYDRGNTQQHMDRYRVVEIIENAGFQVLSVDTCTIDQSVTESTSTSSSSLICSSSLSLSTSAAVRRLSGSNNNTNYNTPQPLPPRRTSINSSSAITDTRYYIYFYDPWHEMLIMRCSNRIKTKTIAWSHSSLCISPFEFWNRRILCFHDWSPSNSCHDL
jgi:hypothetical protein